jgi:hypothetical protein
MKYSYTKTVTHNGVTDIQSEWKMFRQIPEYDYTNWKNENVYMDICP